MNPRLKDFFKEITINKQLQVRLYHTKNVSDVAIIAHELNFEISPVEILKAQAARLIELAANNPEEARLATAGKKPNFGAQWGREGKGFLEYAGYWFIQFYRWGYFIQSVNKDLTDFLSSIDKNSELESKINNCKTINDISKASKESGFEISPITLLVYQALCILSLKDHDANLVAAGASLTNE